LPVEWPLGCDDLIISCGYAPLKKEWRKTECANRRAFH
jgi:hypothetical protein